MEALLSDIHIAPSLVSNIISKLDSHKARKGDMIPAAILKKCSPELALVLSSNSTTIVSLLSSLLEILLVPVFENPQIIALLVSYRILAKYSRL